MGTNGPEWDIAGSARGAVPGRQCAAGPEPAGPLACVERTLAFGARAHWN